MAPYLAGRNAVLEAIRAGRRVRKVVVDASVRESDATVRDVLQAARMAHIPIEAVLKGIDRTFEKYEARRQRMRKINSLAYCHQEILSAVADQERATLQHPSSPEPFPRTELIAYLETNATTVQLTAERFAEQSRPESAARHSCASIA